jgi:hypothetical protein
MRTLIYTAFVSLDGVVDSPGDDTSSEAHRSGGWTYKDIEFLPEAYELKGRETEEATALMFGRTSYEAFSPGVAGHAGLRRPQGTAEVRRLDHPGPGRPGRQLG